MRVHCARAGAACDRRLQETLQVLPCDARSGSDAGVSENRRTAASPLQALPPSHDVTLGGCARIIGSPPPNPCLEGHSVSFPSCSRFRSGWPPGCSDISGAPRVAMQFTASGNLSTGLTDVSRDPASRNEESGTAGCANHHSCLRPWAPRFLIQAPERFRRFEAPHVATRQERLRALHSMTVGMCPCCGPRSSSTQPRPRPMGDRDKRCDTCIPHGTPVRSH
jgi:hypothetical protein